MLLRDLVRVVDLGVSLRILLLVVVVEGHSGATWMGSASVGPGFAGEALRTVLVGGSFEGLDRSERRF